MKEKIKELNLPKKKLTINYKVGELEKMDFENQQFDAIAIIFALFPANIKSLYHKKLDGYLKKTEQSFLRKIK
jgi:ubiquinone/menaquinone biosynthesis C-methylase UbiE